MLGTSRRKTNPGSWGTEGSKCCLSWPASVKGTELKRASGLANPSLAGPPSSSLGLLRSLMLLLPSSSPRGSTLPQGCLLGSLGWAERVERLLRPCGSNGVVLAEPGSGRSLGRADEWSVFSGMCLQAWPVGLTGSTTGRGLPFTSTGCWPIADPKSGEDAERRLLGLVVSAWTLLPLGLEEESSAPWGMGPSLASPEASSRAKLVSNTESRMSSVPRTGAPTEGRS